MIDAGQPSENRLTTGKIGRGNSYCYAWPTRSSLPPVTRRLFTVLTNSLWTIG
jgi:hypothetical protein